MFRTLLVAAALSGSLAAVPVWSRNTTSNFVLLRSPDFVLRESAAPVSAVLSFAALGSPRPPEGTTQAKLLGAAAIYLNGVLVSVGPGHDVPTASQVVRSLDLRPFLRSGRAPNALGIASFFARQYATGPSDVPRVEATLTVVDGSGAYNVTATGETWSAWPADAYFNPTGDAGISWYPMPNEFLDRRAYPLGWAEPGFAPPAGPWPAAVTQLPWATPLLAEPGPAPTVLVRAGPCAVTRVNASRQILDYGQEFMGGVNLSFGAAGTPGAKVTVTVAEELLPGGGGVLSPARTGNRWSSVWTLSGRADLDTGIHHHEFIQFRYAQIDGSPVDFAAGDSAAAAWVVQHPAGGDGRNPFEQACATSVPAADAFGSGSPPDTRTPLGSWASSDAALDTVWNFTAYTIVATSLDVNVDGQTRERDVDVVDALNTALGQYYVFSPADTSVQRRTLLEMFTNDTGMWTQWLDFKTSSVLAAHAHALYTGDVPLLQELWSDNDLAIRADDSGGSYNSLQFEACLRYFNTSGNGLLHFNPNGSCGGSWACEPLVDWPTGTRDGYDCGNDNTDDTVRSALGAMAYGALSEAATWLNKTAAAERYSSMATAVLASLRRLNLRSNSTEAYFVDGAVGAPASHAAVHSTLYAISAGAADGDADLGRALTTFLQRHGVAPSSCMMGRWWITGLLRLGVWAPEAADLALDVLTAPGYPSWLNMLAQGASCTMEAWRPQDKSNLDWAHPWCASPSFTVPGSLLGAAPLQPGWARWRLAPQASTLTSISASVPSPAGMISITFAGVWSSPPSANATVTLDVLAGQAAEVCLCAPGPAPAQAAAVRRALADVLYVDGAPAASAAWGRFSCTAADLLPGHHIVSRVLSS